MNEEAFPAIQNPRMDDRPIWDNLSGIFGYPAVLVSHDLKLFSFLAEKSCTLPEMCNVLGIASRPASALLSVNVSLRNGLRVGHGISPAGGGRDSGPARGP